MIFDFVSLMTSGSSTGTIVRPKVHYARPPHPPPDPPIPEASALGQETRHSLFTPHCLAQAELEHTKQRHSFPDRLVRSRSSDIVCPGRRPTSDPGLNRRVAVEERDPAGVFTSGPSSSPSKDSLKGEVTTHSSILSQYIRLLCVFFFSLCFVAFPAVVCNHLPAGVKVCFNHFSIKGRGQERQ